MKTCWHPKKEKVITTGCKGKHNQEIRKRQARAKTKTISAVESSSCMVVSVKGCLGWQSPWNAWLYRHKGGSQVELSTGGRTLMGDNAINGVFFFSVDDRGWRR